jgi:hypothetical protein
VADTLLTLWLVQKKEGLETPDVQNEVPGPQYFQQF